MALSPVCSRARLLVQSSAVKGYRPVAGKQGREKPKPFPILWHSWHSQASYAARPLRYHSNALRNIKTAGAAKPQW